MEISNSTDFLKFLIRYVYFQTKFCCSKLDKLKNEEQTKEIEAEAHRQAEEILIDTDEYIIDQLSELEEQLMKTLTTVRNGLRHVQQTRSSTQQPSGDEEEEEGFEREAQTELSDEA